MVSHVLDKHSATGPPPAPSLPAGPVASTSSSVTGHRTRRPAQAPWPAQPSACVCTVPLGPRSVHDRTAHTGAGALWQWQWQCGDSDSDGDVDGIGHLLPGTLVTRAVLTLRLETSLTL